MVDRIVGVPKGDIIRTTVVATAMSEQRDQFRNRVEALVKQVSEWAEPHEWATKPYPKKMRDVESNVYQISSLFLQKGPIRVLLDPVSIRSPLMPNRRFDWHEHVKDVEGEYRAARIAVDRLNALVAAMPDLLENDDRTRAYLLVT